MKTKIDNVNHPPHYTWLKDKCGIEVIDITRHMDFCLGNAIKYMEEKDNKVNHPSHYNQGGIECIDAMESAYGTEAVIMFCMCNAFKYQWRFNEKNGREDILKCQWYQNKMVELQNKLNNKEKDI